MEFRPYLHIERFGNAEVEGIELGESYVFPKLDGTNASIWANYKGDSGGLVIATGSRTREINPANDNAGFANWINNNYVDLKFDQFLEQNPKLRLFGEWLVPHSFKGYRSDSWKKFYVFDIFNDETEQYLSYNSYQPILDQFGILYIPPLAVVRSGTYEKFLELVNNNFFLCPDGGEPGEGIVIKNYDYQNKFGRQCFAKIVRQEFKELHSRTMGAPILNGGLMNEERILNKCLTVALIDKTIAKISLDQQGWTSKYIPQLFGRIYYDIVKEELFDSLKEIDFGTVNFKTLRAIMINKIKQLKPEIF